MLTNDLLTLKGWARFRSSSQAVDATKNNLLVNVQDYYTVTLVERDFVILLGFALFLRASTQSTRRATSLDVFRYRLSV